MPSAKELQLMVEVFNKQDKKNYVKAGKVINLSSGSAKLWLIRLGLVDMTFDEVDLELYKDEIVRCGGNIYKAAEKGKIPPSL